MTNVHVHRDPQVEGLIDLYDELLTESNYELPIQTHLKLLSERVLTGHKNKHTGITFVVAKKFGNKNTSEVFSSDFTLEDAQDCVSRDFGYKNWSDVTNLETLKPDLQFESLIDSLLAGDLNRIKNAVAEEPELVHQRSIRPHKATLLHYTGSNGVEAYRQVVPSNLPEIVDFLLSSGADISLKAEIYGGCTAENLMKTSKHPHDAGMIEELQSVFSRYHS